VPGEQPKQDGLIKLNTNENPYPPSPHVLAAISEATNRLRLYPDPGSLGLRESRGVL
jgi:histidinol-phosphate aminotransferase